MTIDRFADAVVFVVIRSYSSIIAGRQGKGQGYFLRVL